MIVKGEAAERKEGEIAHLLWLASDDSHGCCIVYVRIEMKVFYGSKTASLA